MSQAAIAEGHEAYERRYAGLEATGESGMTFLEEMIEAAMAVTDGKPTGSGSGRRFGAAALTESGRMYVGCNVESSGDPTLNVTAERTCLLKAVSEVRERERERGCARARAGACVGWCDITFVIVTRILYLIIHDYTNPGKMKIT